MRPLPYGLIASVQASGTEPLNHPDILCALAQSCLDGGAVGLRLSDLTVITQCRQLARNPFIIGLTKPAIPPADPLGTVYITPTIADALAVCQAGADMVALDATIGPDRHRTEPLAHIVGQVRQQYPQCGIMADCATVEDALNAHALGIDVVSTTLSGYTTRTVAHAQPYAPDWALLQAIRKQCPLPVVLEGHVWDPEQVQQGIQAGASAVIVGSAVSRPFAIVHYLAQGLPTAQGIPPA
jgi:N-acylglucosamine-6-phosphate 2-epimerase